MEDKEIYLIKKLNTALYEAEEVEEFSFDSKTKSFTVRLRNNETVVIRLE